MNTKKRAALLLDLLILVCTAVGYWLLYSHFRQDMLRNILAACLAVPAVTLCIYEFYCHRKFRRSVKKTSLSVSTLALLGADDRPIQIWDLTGKTGLLIGKSEGHSTVDIDLAGTDFEGFVDAEHAILNYRTTGWWLQDTSDRNGVSIHRKGREMLLSHNAPARLEPGDIIAIAGDTRIAVN